MEKGNYNIPDLLAIFIALNSRSHYICSEDGKCGAYIYNNWMLDFIGKPTYSTDIYIWGSDKPDTIIATLNGEEPIELELLSDGYLQTHNIMYYYGAYEGPSNEDFIDELTIQWQDSNGKTHSYTISDNS